ncbi:MAG: anhydro-N-acetylmuramic acid kinase, partial [Bacteroidetes bacterium]|nr:anhydro-N-acetylmuramic acid kinase [Bacteroidota bacterium]
MITSKNRRCVAGVMSGTSLDGIDVVIARMEGHGRELQIEKWYGATYSFPKELHRSLKLAASQESTALSEEDPTFQVKT